MKVFKPLLLVILGLASSLAFGQAKGNYDYRSVQNSFIHNQSRLIQSSYLASLEAHGTNTLRVRGLMNCKPSSYLAIFSLTQVGKDQEETSALVQAKTDSILAKLAAQGIETEMYVDMISFIPIFEVELSRKLFSKNTYNEIPKGFELKKNLHFRYSDPAVLNEILSLCAQHEIYDLVRVDYFIEDMEALKRQMVAKAETLLQAKIGRYQRLLGEDFKNQRRRMAEGFTLHYPIEQYQSYTAYVSNKFNVKPGAGVSEVPKTTSEFYMPKMAKGYDFVENPSILEPVVQMEYELVLQLDPRPEKPEPPKEVEKEVVKKEVYIIDGNGQLRKIEL
jgi:hypothetical protein